MTQKITLNSQHKYEKVFDAQSVAAFAELSQDDNPIHINEAYAKESIFGRNVVHGVFLVSMFSKIFGTIFPGNGGIYLGQTAKFTKPAFVGDKVTAVVTLTAFDEEKKRGIFTCECFNPQGELLVTGEAKILFPKHFSLNA